MKKPTILLSLLAAPLLLLFAFQYYYHPLPATADLPYIKSSEDKQWFKMKEDAHIAVDELLEKHSTHLGIHAPADWRLYRSEVDDLGMTHDRYQLYYDDIPVEGAELLVHSVQGEVRHFNGCWIPDMQVQMSVALSSDDAIQVALNEVPAQRYAWEDAGAERLLKMVRRDPEATAYPQPELVCYSPTFPRKGAAFKAAYKLIVQAYKPLTRTLLYIDASSGHILDRMELLEHVNTPAIAETRYHGTQSIITDSIAPDSFILYETTRGHGVHTMNLQGSDEPEDAVEFSDEDNYWNNYNDQQDEVATDAHFSAEMTFDFLDQHLGHVGVDGDSMQLLCLVHYGENVVNAFWNGDWCTLGDGDGDLWTPLTSLDVVGHEFGHGVTQN
ncbi:MAG TPA: hypothetical protein ENJ45_04805, partial [Phaeodactylibacter sp.]|nr:hypothetical protein [Phaeodactylibacter sp.]